MKLKNEKFLIDQQIKRIKELKQKKTDAQKSNIHSSPGSVPKKKGQKLPNKKPNLEINPELQAKHGSVHKKKTER
jgi:hypothetical protein